MCCRPTDLGESGPVLQPGKCLPPGLAVARLSRGLPQGERSPISARPGARAGGEALRTCGGALLPADCADRAAPPRCVIGGRARAAACSPARPRMVGDPSAEYPGRDELAISK